MKILYLVTYADMGGAQKYVLSLAQHFHGTIAAGDEHNELFLAAKKLGIETYRLKHIRRQIHPIHDLLAIFEIKKLIDKLRPDIVHLNSSKVGFLGSIAGKLSRSKVIYTAHGFAFLEKNWRTNLRWFEKIVGPFRDAVIAVSNADAQAALHHGLVGREKLTVIHNGMDRINFFDKTEARQKLNLPTDKIIIGTIANLYPNKGIDILLEATRNNSNSDQIYAVIGDGPEMTTLRAQIQKFGLENKFLLLGNKANASQMIKAFDIFVLPSRKEGFPFVLIEALQAGLPIIATSVGGVPELLDNSAILVEPENPTKLAEAISNLSTNVSEKNRLSEMALRRSQNFNRESMLQKTTEIYEKLIPRKNG